MCGCTSHGVKDRVIKSLNKPFISALYEIDDKHDKHFETIISNIVCSHICELIIRLSCITGNDTSFRQCWEPLNLTPVATVLINVLGWRYLSPVYFYSSNCFPGTGRTWDFSSGSWTTLKDSATDQCQTTEHIVNDVFDAWYHVFKHYTINKQYKCSKVVPVDVHVHNLSFTITYNITTYQICKSFVVQKI